MFHSKKHNEFSVFLRLFLPLSLVSFICLFTLMLHSHFSRARIFIQYLLKKRAKRFVTVHTISLTPCDNDQWNLFICILTRIASIFHTKMKEKRSEAKRRRINICFLHHDFNVVVSICFFCCRSVNKCKCTEVYLHLNVFYQQSKTGDKRFDRRSDNSITKRSDWTTTHYVCLLSIAWTWPSQPLKWHLLEQQLHYNCNLSVLLHLFHFILLFRAIYVTLCNRTLYDFGISDSSAKEKHENLVLKS